MVSSAGSLGFGALMAKTAKDALGDIYSDTDWFYYPI